MSSFSSIYRSWSRWRWPATLGSRSAAAAGAGRRESTSPTAIERPPAESDDHVAGGLGDGQAGADGRGNGLLDQVDLAGARALGGLAYRAPLDLGDARGNGDDDARLDQRRAVVRGPDEVAQHGRGDLEVGDDPVLHRPDDDDVPGRTPEHLLRLLSDREHRLAAARVLLHGHHAGLVGDDARAADVDERVRGTEVDCEVAREKLVQPTEHGAL